MQSMLINPPNGHQNPIKGGCSKEIGLRKIHQKSPENQKIQNFCNCRNNYCNNPSSVEETLQQTLQGDWSPLGGHPPRSSLSIYMARRGFSALLLNFLLDIGPSLGLYLQKIWGPSQAKRIKASYVLSWRMMAKSIHDLWPSIWTSSRNFLRS